MLVDKQHVKAETRFHGTDELVLLRGEGGALEFGPRARRPALETANVAARRCRRPVRAPFRGEVPEFGPAIQFGQYARRLLAIRYLYVSHADFLGRGHRMLDVMVKRNDIARRNLDFPEHLLGQEFDGLLFTYDLFEQLPIRVRSGWKLGQQRIDFRITAEQLTERGVAMRIALPRRA